MNSISLPAGSPLLKNSFLYGTATSSFQIEGDVDNRLECIWDRFCERPNGLQPLLITPMAMSPVIILLGGEKISTFC